MPPRPCHPALSAHSFATSSVTAHRPITLSANASLKRLPRSLEKTSGRLNIQVFPNSQLGGDNDLLSQVRSGAVEFFPAAGLILASVLPVTAIDGMGFAFPNYDKVWEAMDGDLGAYVRTQIASNTNLVPMNKMWDLGYRQVTQQCAADQHRRRSDRSETQGAGRPAARLALPGPRRCAGQHAVR